MNEQLSTYYSRIDPNHYRILLEYQSCVESVFPGGVWDIKYGIPTYVYKGKNLIHFGVNKAHLGVYPGPKGIQALLSLDSTIIFTKGTWKIPYKVAAQRLSLLKQWLVML